MKKKLLIITLILIAFQGFSQEEPFSFHSLKGSNWGVFDIKTDNPLYNLIGKEVFGKESFDFTSSLGIPETESFQDIRHLQYFASGVEIVYKANDEKIASIFLLAPNYSSWYEAFTGKLPYGLNWNMTKSEVENRIGNGEEYHRMSDVFYQYKSLQIEITYFKGSENPYLKSIQIRDFEEKDLSIMDTIGEDSIDMRIDSEMPNIAIHDSSQYAPEFIKNLKDLTTYRSFELIEDKIIVDNRETMEFPYYPFLGDTLYYAKEDGDSSVYLTVMRINQTTITYQLQMLKSGKEYKEEDGWAHLNPYDIINGDGFSISEDEDGEMYWSVFFRNQKPDGCFTDVYVGSNRGLAAMENHCVSEFRYNSEKNFINLEQINKEE
ncbi:MAG: hypothetical protein GX159_09385 [Flavobacteriaceae bacterium]|jgi:hypothetical protein|nr:hypothetical protein [Flavobacteriaceae bacterium]